MQILIKLDEPENYNINPDLFPTITHAQLVNIKWEVSRPHSSKEGSIELWFAKGYLHDGVFYEAPNYPGMNINISDPAVQGIMESDVMQGVLYDEITRVFSQLMIELGEISGVLEVA